MACYVRSMDMSKVCCSGMHGGMRSRDRGGGGGAGRDNNWDDECNAFLCSTDDCVVPCMLAAPP